MTIPPSPVGPSSTPSSPENRGTTTTTTTTVESETKHAAQPQLPRPRQRVPLGYTKLAGFMVKRDQEMFRRFRRMAVRDILYLQAELCDLEHQFDRRALGDANGGDPEVYFDREWWHLKESGGHQWKLALQIREKVAEYCEL
ncbi:hypothetical protein MKZ38_006563 [Zalerion maritima]|uniref:DUF6594 domain-containing protein n=1 Tax=Zalerion maritima TaxID=339359 RepID=A0AAD5WVK2_9PEZI|nr:hypothetical protein MKZ38_006563 [Zalerion maritima]